MKKNHFVSIYDIPCKVYNLYIVVHNNYKIYHQMCNSSNLHLSIAFTSMYKCAELYVAPRS